MKITPMISPLLQPSTMIQVVIQEVAEPNDGKNELAEQEDQKKNRKRKAESTLLGEEKRPKTTNQTQIVKCAKVSSHIMDREKGNCSHCF